MTGEKAFSIIREELAGEAQIREHPLSGRQLVFGMSTLRGAFLTTSIVLIIAFFGATNASPFIYFRF
jgi:hypothetical protein